MNHVMIDLETMGLGSDAAIIAIGAVSFNETDGIIDRFYEVVNLQSSMDLGLTVDASTILWWMEQKKEARREFTDTKVFKNDIKVALQNFTNWMSKLRMDSVQYSIDIWGNGAAFDNVVLANAYKAAKMPVPWRFWEDRCYRTVSSMHDVDTFTRVGVHHNALNDAESQALHLISILNGDTKQ
jgi:hypothetical protein